MEYVIREMEKEEYKLLESFLYEAIFQRDEDELLSRDIINQEEMQVYIRDFGSLKDDYCLCALVDKKIVGAVWVRSVKGYGNIDDKTPEFAISLYKEYRNYGIGTALMIQMMDLLKKKGYRRASLAVQKDNYATKMYEKIGFTIYSENNEEYIMKWEI